MRGKMILGFVGALLICSTIGITRIKPSKASQQIQPGKELTVANKTHAFNVVSAIRDGDIVKLSLRNGYLQAITAFTISGGPNSGVQVDLVMSGHEIAPGASYEFRDPVVNLEPSGSPDKSLALTILNVVLEDGTGDGDPEATANIINRRLGEKIALNRILPLLSQAVNTSDLETPEGARRLKERITFLCEALEREQPSLVRGIRHGKGYVLGDIEQAEKERGTVGAVEVKKEVLKIKEHYEKALLKLSSMVAQ